MSVGLEFKNQKDYLLVTVTGMISNYQELLALIRPIVHAVSQHEAKKVLLNMLQFKDNTGYLEAVMLSETKQATAMVMKGVRFASIHTPEEGKKRKSFETPFNIRSLNYKAFSEWSQALDWLAT